MDFEKLDSLRRFQYPEDKYLIAKEHNCKWVSECVATLRSQDKPVREIAEIMQVSENTMITWMQLWGIKSGPQGGNNKNPALKDPVMIQKIMDLKGKMTPRLAALALGFCTYPTIKKLWSS